MANVDKSSVYFGDIKPEIQQDIPQTLEFTKGEMPFRYLGIPLSIKRLSTIQLLWSQVFVLPKKVIQLVETTCKTFLWTGGSDTSKKALIAWERLCQPRVAGGLNILDVYSWNHVAIGKLLWNVCRKKDNLWVKWIHTYYTKGGAIWDIKPAQASWMVQKIFKAKLMFELAGITEDTVATMSIYSIKKIYGLIRGDYPKMPWRRILCNNAEMPKWLFILFLALHRRLQTKDRIACWENLEDMICPLCLRENEDIDHMLFQCDYAKEVWNKLLQW
nr:uncharacterized protein LOC104111748 isoform X1 [Nicotiana tomentosiformis]XP_033516040.1 uncharacterized protein LOC104111748 isoform X1 [Nicotiana tomentosiformis]XP_033516041.1 uncharacterized protein LOC104111748 isoform X1 [Nicotiana tomentosiformis]